MTELDGDRPGPRIFYGWTIVGTVFIILMVTSGLGFYNASVILNAGTEELDVSVGAVSGATALFFGISGLTGFALSRKMDTSDLRYFYVVGGVLGAGALWSLRWVDSVGLLYLFFAVFGVGFSLAGLVPSTTLVTRWFSRRRSVALSIASTGLSLGGIAVTPVAAWLIDRRGLGGAGPLLAVIWIVGVVPLGVLLIRSRPSDMGLEPDGDRTAPVAGAMSSDATANPSLGATADATANPSGEATAQATANSAGEATADSTANPSGEATAQATANSAGGATAQATKDEVMPGATFAIASRTRFFVMMCVTYALIFFAQVGGLAHLFNLASERVDKTTAGTALSLLAATSVAGRLIGGLVVLRVSTKALSTTLTLFQAVALVALAFSFSSITILGSAVLLGISVGNLLMLQPLLLAEAFGVAEYSRIYSFNQLMSTLGVGGGPFVLGLVHDVRDYRLAFSVAAAASVVGFATFILAGSTRAAAAAWSD